MKNEIVEMEKNKYQKMKGKKITRKDAIKKTGKMALSAVATMLLLNSPAQASSSPAAPPSRGDRDWR